MKYLKSNSLNITLVIVSAFFIGMISSCKDDKDTEAPGITMVHPKLHELYLNGDTIFWKGTVTDNESVAHVEMTMWPEDDSTNLLFSVHVHPNATSYSIDTFFVVNEADTTEYYFKVFAEDAAGNSSSTVAECAPEECHLHINAD